MGDADAMQEMELHRIEKPAELGKKATAEGQEQKSSINMPQNIASNNGISNSSSTPNETLTKELRLKKKEEEMVKIKKKIGVMLLVAFVCLLFGLTCGGLWPSYFHDILNKELVLSSNSTSYKMWVETPVPMYLKIYLFNWTNADEFANNNRKLHVKPNFKQMGPYVFREIDIKVNKIWNKNKTITFQQRRVWHFEQSMSNGDLSDKVTNLNPIAATIVYTMRGMKNIYFNKIFNALLSKFEKCAITKTVQELLFDGYEDELLSLAVHFNKTKLPYSKFAWFYKRNNSDSYDGTFNMLTGEDNLYDRGILKEWKFKDVSPYYSKTCGKVGGTNGDLWPPLLNNKTVSVFSPDVCTTITLKANGTSDWLGLTGSKFISDEDTFDNGTRVESRKCYCEGIECQPSGALNVSACKFGAPVFVSAPHFYLADDSYRANITGMNPNKKDHEFVLVVQPDTGVPMQVRAALQINFLVQSAPEYLFFRNLPQMHVPMIWFTQEVNLTSEYASQVKLLTILPPAISGILYSLAGIGVLLVIISIIVYVRQRLKPDDTENLISKDNETGVKEEVTVTEGE